LDLTVSAKCLLIIKKEIEKAINFSAAMTYFAGKHHTLKLGGEYQQYTLRRWTIGGQDDLASLVGFKVRSKPQRKH
jgi:hypothetical protein